MHSKLLLKKLQVKNRSVWHSVKCVVSRRRHREGRIEHRDSALISDQTERRLHWHNEQEDSRRHSLKGGQALRATKIEGQENM